ncbi:MAG: response regulator transcription factor [Leptospiraceae bacterium]|nr:response regulator transcription factor [Leptospiraceae bacterium]
MTLLTTTTSKGALDLFLSDPTLVVILDLNMPEKSGKEIIVRNICRWI